MTTSDTVVIIPAYNESKVIGSVIDDLLVEFKHVVVVDDGSSDRTDRAARKPNCEVIVHPINLGAGAATQTGIDFALQNDAYKYFITFDADGQHSVEDAKTMLQHIKENDVDIVLGSRFMGQIENIGSIKKKVFITSIYFLLAYYRYSAN